VLAVCVDDLDLRVSGCREGRPGGGDDIGVDVDAHHVSGWADELGDQRSVASAGADLENP
jgi:hypothetical protein